MMVLLARGFLFDDQEPTESFIHASGPGGQNVNKLSTAVQLRLDVAASPSIPQGVKDRLPALAGRRLTRDGVLIITAQRFRSQDRNRQDARERLLALLNEAAQTEALRRPSKPTRAARRRRMDEKGQHGQTKRLRRNPAAERDD